MERRLRMKVYVASRTPHAAMWRNLRDKWDEFNIHINSSWIYKHQIELDSIHSDEVFTEGWERSIAEVQHSRYLVTYSREGETLRGALIEIGAALGIGTPVLIVGWCSDVYGTHGSWQFHPLVSKVPDFDAAKEWLLNAKI
jgi:hypothetical protein